MSEDTKKVPRAAAAKSAVTGTYKKSRTEEVSKPDPKRRGAAALKLLRDIESARMFAAEGRKGVARSIKRGKSSEKTGSPKVDRLVKELDDTRTAASHRRKVNEHRQVQALKQAYEKLPESEKVAARRTLIKEGGHNPLGYRYSFGRVDRALERVEPFSESQRLAKERRSGKKRSK